MQSLKTLSVRSLFPFQVACGALAVTIGSAIAHLDSILQYPTSEQPKTRIDQLDQCLK